MNNPVATRIADIEDKRGGLLSVLELASSNGATFVVQFLDRSIMRVEIIDGEGGLPGEKVIDEQYSRKAVELVAQRLAQVQE